MASRTPKILSTGIVILLAAWGSQITAEQIIVATSPSDFDKDPEEPMTLVVFDIGPDGVPINPFSVEASGISSARRSQANLAYDPVGSFLFFENNFSNEISVFKIVRQTLFIEVAGSPFLTDPKPIQLALHPTFPQIYVGNIGRGTLKTFEYADDGWLTKINEVEFFGAPKDLKVSPNGKFLYATRHGSGLSAYNISSDGSLETLPGFPFGPGFGRPSDIEISSDGSRLFVLHLDAGLSVYDLDDMGTPHLVPGSPFDLGGFVPEMALSNDNQFVFLFRPIGTLFSMKISPDGTPSMVPNSSTAAGTDIIDLLVHSKSSRLYSISRSRSTIRTFDIEEDGTLTRHEETVPIISPGKLPHGALEIDVQIQSRQVPIDVKPDTDRNQVNIRSNGNIPVIVLGSESLDVSQIDHDSIRLGTGLAKPSHSRPHIFQDFNLDGFQDYIAHFRIQSSGLACGDISIILIGDFVNGEAFDGSDIIETLGCN